MGRGRQGNHQGPERPEIPQSASRQKRLRRCKRMAPVLGRRQQVADPATCQPAICPAAQVRPWSPCEVEFARAAAGPQWQYLIELAEPSCQQLQRHQKSHLALGKEAGREVYGVAQPLKITLIPVRSAIFGSSLTRWRKERRTRRSSRRERQPHSRCGTVEPVAMLGVNRHQPITTSIQPQQEAPGG